MQKYFKFLTFILCATEMLMPEVFAYCYNGVGCTCSVNVTGMNFGIYTFLNKIPVTTTASINVNCTASTAGAQIGYEITLGTGNSGTYQMRQMNNGSATLNYNIYTSLAYQNIWGDATSGTQSVSDNYTITQILTRYIKYYSAYSVISAAQNVPGGIYSDNIVVSVIF